MDTLLIELSNPDRQVLAHLKNTGGYHRITRNQSVGYLNAGFTADNCFNAYLTRLTVAYYVNGCSAQVPE